MNIKLKKQINTYQILKPYTDINEKIKYENDIFIPKDNNDKEAINLIEFLGFNKPELVSERVAHIERLKWLENNLNNEEFIEYFKRNKEALSFITALKTEFSVNFGLLQ